MMKLENGFISAANMDCLDCHNHYSVGTYYSLKCNVCGDSFPQPSNLVMLKCTNGCLRYFTSVGMIPVNKDENCRKASFSNCTLCGGDGLVDVNINCTHGKTSSHSYCSHGYTDYHS